MLLELIKKARSVRGFREDRKVTDEELRYLVECARFTPSARNAQVLKYRLVNQPEELRKVQMLTKWGGALPELHLPFPGTCPQAFIVICQDYRLSDSPAAFQKDVGIVAQTMLLAANDMGLGGCMILSFNAWELKNVLGLGEELKPQLVLALGEPMEDIRMVDVDGSGSVAYYRDGENVHYVPKRTLEELIIGE